MNEENKDLLIEYLKQEIQMLKQKDSIPFSGEWTVVDFGDGTMRMAFAVNAPFETVKHLDNKRSNAYFSKESLS